MDLYDSYLRKKAYNKMDSAIKWGNKNSEVKINNMTEGFMQLPEVSKPEFERRVIKSRDILQHADNRLMSKMLKLDSKIHKAEANLKYKKLAKLKTKRNLMDAKLNKYDFRLNQNRSIPEDMNYSNCINFNVIDKLHRQDDELNLLRNKLKVHDRFIADRTDDIIKAHIHRQSVYDDAENGILARTGGVIGGVAGAAIPGLTAYGIGQGTGVCPVGYAAVLTVPSAGLGYGIGKAIGGGISKGIHVPIANSKLHKLNSQLNKKYNEIPKNLIKSNRYINKSDILPKMRMDLSNKSNEELLELADKYNNAPKLRASVIKNLNKNLAIK